MPCVFRLQHRWAALTSCLPLLLTPTIFNTAFADPTPAMIKELAIIIAGCL